MRFVLLLALVIPVLPAQNFTGKIKLKSLLPPIDQPWKSSSSKPIFSITAPTAGTSPCSIPLLPAKPVETDAAMLLPPSKGKFAIREVTPPAPPCQAGRP